MNSKQIYLIPIFFSFYTGQKWECDPTERCYILFYHFCMSIFFVQFSLFLMENFLTSWNCIQVAFSRYAEAFLVLFTVWTFSNTYILHLILIQVLKAQHTQHGRGGATIQVLVLKLVVFGVIGWCYWLEASENVIFPS